MRVIASKLDAAECIDFYLDAKKYVLLFDAVDRKETAMRLWNRYLDPKADRMITIPDDIHNELKKEILTHGSSEVNLFDRCIKVHTRESPLEGETRPTLRLCWRDPTNFVPLLTLCVCLFVSCVCRTVSGCAQPDDRQHLPAVPKEQGGDDATGDEGAAAASFRRRWMLLGDVMSWVSRVRWEGWVGRSAGRGHTQCRDAVGTR